MGCATSKQNICQNCQAPYSTVPRSYSVQVNHHHHHHHHHHHPSPKRRDTYQVVALTSSSPVSLNLHPSDPSYPTRNRFCEDLPPAIQSRDGNESPAKNSEIDVSPMKKSTKEAFQKGMIEAKAWSMVITDKIPKIIPRTPARTPPGEPDTINAWEVMEGLGDISPLHPAARHARHFRSFSFHIPSSATPSSPTTDHHPTPCINHNQHHPPSLPKPTWQDSVDIKEDPIFVSNFDPDVITTFRRALEQLPPANPFHLKPAGADKHPPCGKERVIVYFTSLRGVRKTYDDCCEVRAVLGGLGVRVDERDVSMHSRFKEELKERLGEGLGGSLGLPMVFIGEVCIGGAHDVRRLSEEGKLERLVEGCEVVGNDRFCETCGGDVRFVPCETCSGSCKIYYDYDGEFEESGFRRCPHCNENGLVRCPICCD